MASQWSPGTFMVGPVYISNLLWSRTSPRLLLPSCCSSDTPHSTHPGPLRCLPVWHTSPRFVCNSPPHDLGLCFSVASLVYPNPSPILPSFPAPSLCIIFFIAPPTAWNYIAILFTYLLPVFPLQTLKRPFCPGLSHRYNPRAWIMAGRRYCPHPRFCKRSF